MTINYSNDFRELFSFTKNLVNFAMIMFARLKRNVGSIIF